MHLHPSFTPAAARRIVALSPDAEFIHPAALSHAWTVARAAHGSHRMDRLTATAPLFCGHPVPHPDPRPDTHADTRPDLPRQPGVAAWLARRMTGTAQQAAQQAAPQFHTEDDGA